MLKDWYTNIAFRDNKVLRLPILIINTERIIVRVNAIGPKKIWMILLSNKSGGIGRLAVELGKGPLVLYYD